MNKWYTFLRQWVAHSNKPEFMAKVRKYYPLVSNFSKEQWTTLQDLAIQENDLEMAQFLRDLHFSVNAPLTRVVGLNGLPQHVYHGSISPSINIFDLSTPSRASMTNLLNKRIYFSNSRGIAALYSADPDYTTALTIDHYMDGGFNSEEIAEMLKKPTSEINRLIKEYLIGDNFILRKTNPDDFIYDAYLNMRHGWEMNLDGLPISRLTKLLRNRINEAPGAILRNVDETVSNLYGIEGYVGNDYLVKYPLQIKSAAAVTYDDLGQRIPLGERDNFHNPDWRYIIGSLLGTGALALSLQDLYKDDPVILHMYGSEN